MTDHIGQARGDAAGASPGRSGSATAPGLSRRGSINLRESTYFYSADGLGSIRTLTNHQGIVTNTYDYTAFGETRDSHPHPQLAITQRYTYTARESSPLAARGAPMYYRYRSYAPSPGRFTRRDPIGYRGNMCGLLYQYANYRPTIYVDKFGLNPAIQVGDPMYRYPDRAPDPRLAPVMLGGPGETYQPSTGQGTFVEEWGGYRVRKMGEWPNDRRKMRCCGGRWRPTWGNLRCCGNHKVGTWYEDKGKYVGAPCCHNKFAGVVGVYRPYWAVHYKTRTDCINALFDQSGFIEFEDRSASSTADAVIAEIITQSTRLLKYVTKKPNPASVPVGVGAISYSVTRMIELRDSCDTLVCNGN